VVKDMQTGKLYNLQITGAKPSVGIGINFTGVPASGAAACAKGDPVRSNVVHPRATAVTGFVSRRMS